MKKSVLLTIVAAVVTLSASAAHAAFTNHSVLPVNFQLTAVWTTNVVKKTTNAAHTITSTLPATTNIITSSNLLTLIATEFNTNFPAGSRIAYSPDADKFFVVDATGAFLLNASSNPNDSSYGFGISNKVPGGVALSGDLEFGKSIEYTNGNSAFAPLVIFSSDYYVFYKDSHDNDFHFGGFSSYNFTQSSTPTNTIYPSISVTVSGPGGGKMVHPKANLPYWVVFPKAQLNANGLNFKP